MIVSSVLLAANAAAQPTLTINGVTASDNSAIPSATKLTPMTISLTGTPGAPFALLMSGDAFDGLPGGEPSITTGFFLKPWEAGAVIDSPVHPVFDGIGTGYIRTQLAAQGQAMLNPDDIVPDFPSPVFRFNAAGQFNVTFTTPATAFLRNNTPSMSFPDPLVIPLESVSLYMQILELNVSNLTLNVGNGVRVDFDPLVFSAGIGYSEGQAASPTATTLGQRQTLGTITDGNFADGSVSGLVTAAGFSGTFAGNVDIWRIALAGIHEGWEQSISPVAENGVTSAPDPEASTNILVAQGHASGLEFLTGSRPQLNNENREYPTIALPGGRVLFHWRNADISLGNPTYGFGIYFQQSNTFRNLTPTAVGNFVGNATKSPWEFEVGVTPDGTRALVILDPLDGSTDRAYVLNLVEGAVFANGLPAYNATPTTSTELTNFRRVWPQSISFVLTNTNNWVGMVCTSNDTTGVPSAYPRNLFRITMSDSTGFTSQVIPEAFGGSLGSVTRIDRQPVVSPDFKKLAVSVGQSAAIENIALVSDVTDFGAASVNNLTSFAISTTILETSDSHNGLGGTMRFSPDSSALAFVQGASDQLPSLVRLNQAGQVKLLVQDTDAGGLFDLTHFRNSRDVFVTADNDHVMFFQGSWKNGPPNDRSDLFVVNATSGNPTNLTRTLASQAVNGPFTAKDATLTPPTIDPSGYLVSPNKKHLYFFRDQRGLSALGFGIDRFNLVAVAIEPKGTLNLPTFELTNVTGKEFAAFPGEFPPTSGTADIIGDGSGVVEGNAHYLHMRRIGGDGPFRNYALMTARYADTSSGAPFADKRLIDQLWMFDLNNPAPAFVLTDFTENAGVIPVSQQAAITNVIPSPVDGKIVYALDPDGVGAMLQDLLMTDLGAFAAVRRIPANAPAFSRLITDGSIKFALTEPAGLVYASGTVPRGSSTTDGISTASDPGNPIDATAFFHRFDQPSMVYPITNSAGANSRAVYVFGVDPQ